LGKEFSMQKIAIVTGGGTGIGRNLVESLANAGFRVAYTYVTPRTDQVLPDRIVNSGMDVSAYECDAGDEGAVDEFYKAYENDFQRAPDLLVNNAGIQTCSPLLDLKISEWDSVIRTNLRGCFLNTRIVARMMIDDGIKGSIINIGSGCNKLAFPNLVDYTASKGGVEQFTKVSAIELGPYGIRVNCVAPGAIETIRTNDEIDNYSDKWAKLTPLRRIGIPADLEGPVLFLESNAAAFVTGQTIWVDGGVFTQAQWPT
jgi:3-oxoacyl-[acyl-carrier protein] reductase